jgi:DNA replication and repair protein RecF
MKFKNDLKERNALLKNDVVDKTLLDIITKRMIEEQYEIFIERQKTINELNRYLVSSYSSLDGETKIELKYCSLVLEQEKEKYCQTLEKLYFDEFEHELKRKTTLIGIHHDDLKIFLDGREIGVYGSQGQNRLSSLALKLAMVSLIKEKIKQDPIIILDDVLSELDAIHQEKLIKTLNGYEQVFITYAKQDLKIPNSTTFVVEDNRITRR